MKTQLHSVKKKRGRTPKDAPYAKIAPHLWAFRAMMNAEGWHVDVTRMAYDRLYGYQRLELGHTSRHDDLRSLSVRLFTLYQTDEPTYRLSTTHITHAPFRTQQYPPRFS